MTLRQNLHFDECIPAFLSTPDPDFFRDCNPSVFGKDDILNLARFWKAREEKFRYKSFHETSIQKSQDFASEADLCEAKSKFLRSLASRAEEKPPIFEKPTVHLNERTAFFVEKPDRFLIGALTRISVDEEANTGAFNIRAFDPKTNKVENFVYEPDGFSIFPENYFIYFRKNPDYLKLYLELHAWSTIDQFKAERMLAVLPPPPPPDAA